MSACSLSEAPPDSISRRVPCSSRISTLWVDSASNLFFAKSRPRFVSCQVFCFLSSPLMVRECSLTCLLRKSSRIARLTFGGCWAQASAIPGRVKEALTTYRSACSSSCKRWSSMRSLTAIFTLGISSDTISLSRSAIQQFPYYADILTHNCTTNPFVRNITDSHGIQYIPSDCSVIFDVFNARTWSCFWGRF